MIRIALLGGPGSGKTTQSTGVFTACKTDSVLIRYVQEWVVEAFDENVLPKDNAWTQLLIYQKQKRKEECIPKEIKYMITDSPTLLCYIYTLWKANIPEDNSLIIDMYEKFLNDLSVYEHIFVCKRGKEYINDGTRYQTKEEAEKLDRLIVHTLEQHHVKYHIIEGDTTKRTDQIRKIVGI